VNISKSGHLDTSFVTGSMLDLHWLCQAVISNNSAVIGYYGAVKACRGEKVVRGKKWSGTFFGGIKKNYLTNSP
jgi:hypothetical protein